MRRRAPNTVRRAKRHDPAQYQRVRQACGDVAAETISLDEHAALIVLDIKARVGRFAIDRRATHADWRQV